MLIEIIASILEKIFNDQKNISFLKNGLSNRISELFDEELAKKIKEITKYNLNDNQQEFYQKISPILNIVLHPDKLNLFLTLIEKSLDVDLNKKVQSLAKPNPQKLKAIKEIIQSLCKEDVGSRVGVILDIFLNTTESKVTKEQILEIITNNQPFLKEILINLARHLTKDENSKNLAGIILKISDKKNLSSDDQTFLIGLLALNILKESKTDEITKLIINIISPPKEEEVSQQLESEKQKILAGIVKNIAVQLEDQKKISQLMLLIKGGLNPDEKITNLLSNQENTQIVIELIYTAIFGIEIKNIEKKSQLIIKLIEIYNESQALSVDQIRDFLTAKNLNTILELITDFIKIDQNENTKTFLSDLGLSGDQINISDVIKAIVIHKDFSQHVPPIIIEFLQKTEDITQEQPNQESKSTRKSKTCIKGLVETSKDLRKEISNSLDNIKESLSKIKEINEQQCILSKIQYKELNKTLYGIIASFNFPLSEEDNQCINLVKKIIQQIKDEKESLFTSEEIKQRLQKYKELQKIQQTPDKVRKLEEIQQYYEKNPGSWQEIINLINLKNLPNFLLQSPHQLEEIFEKFSSSTTTEISKDTPFNEVTISDIIKNIKLYQVSLSKFFHKTIIEITSTEGHGQNKQIHQAISDTLNIHNSKLKGQVAFAALQFKQKFDISIPKQIRKIIIKHVEQIFNTIKGLDPYQYLQEVINENPIIVKIIQNLPNFIDDNHFSLLKKVSLLVNYYKSTSQEQSCTTTDCVKRDPSIGNKTIDSQNNRQTPLTTDAKKENLHDYQEQPCPTTATQEEALHDDHQEQPCLTTATQNTALNENNQRTFEITIKKDKYKIIRLSIEATLLIASTAMLITKFIKKENNPFINKFFLPISIGLIITALFMVTVQSIIEHKQIMSSVTIEPLTAINHKKR